MTYQEILLSGLVGKLLRIKLREVSADVVAAHLKGMLIEIRF